MIILSPLVMRGKRKDPDLGWLAALLGDSNSLTAVFAVCEEKFSYLTIGQEQKFLQ